MSLESRAWFGTPGWVALAALSSMGAASASRAQDERPQATPGDAARATQAPATDAGPLELTEADAPAGYLEAIEAGVAEYDVGHYEEARVQFVRAHGLAPSARTLRALGNVDFELRNYGDSVRHLEAALASLTKPLRGELRESTEKLLARAKVYVGEVHVNVQPGSATVSVDGVMVGRGPEASIALLVGQHVFEFRAQGRVPERRAVQVSPGQTTTIEVVMSPSTDPKQVAQAYFATSKVDESTHGDSKPLRKQWWLWTAVGIAVAAVAVGAVVATDHGDTRRVPVQSGDLSAVVEAP